MIISEPYISPTALSPLIKIYSDQHFLIQSKGIYYQEAIVATDEEINNFIETSIAIPDPIADAYFVYNTFISKQYPNISEKQIILAKTFLNKALTNLTDEEAYQIRFLFNEWDENKNYEVGDRVLYNKELYNVIQIPKTVAPPNLNTECFIKTNRPLDLVEEWNNLNQKVYNTGDRVKIGQYLYESLIDNNSWSPQAFPAVWRLIN